MADLDIIASDFVDSQRSGSTIPVIGDGVFLYKESETSSIPVLDYVVNRFREDFQVRYPELFSSLDPNREADLYTLTCISHVIKKNVFKGKYIKYIDEAMKMDRIAMDPDVLDFLIAFNFPVIVTTCCFRYPEACINKVSKRKYQEVNYDRKGQNVEPDFFNLLESGGIIYHLFGSVDSRRDWVYDEEEMLEFLHSLHSSDDYSCVNLSRYTSTEKSSILILGCGLPDWLFRFIWYTIGRAQKDESTGLWLRSENCNLELDLFLKNIGYKTIPTIKDFLRKATGIMNLQNCEKSKPTLPLNKYDFFISYAGEDRAIAEKLYSHLQSRGYTVWFDMRGVGEIKWGSKYLADIAEGISLSDHAITIITENYFRGLREIGRGLYKETVEIMAKAKKVDTRIFHFCMPLIIKNRMYYGKEITPALVEDCSRYVGVGERPLSELFTGTSMKTTSADNPEIPLVL